MSDSQNQSHTPWHAPSVSPLSSSNLAIDKFLDTSVLPPFFNGGFDKGQIKNLVGWFLKQYGEKKTIDFLERLKIGIDAYVKNEIFEDDKIETLEEFVKWMYKEYGIIYHGNT